MIRAPHRRPGFLAAILHRLSGIALAVFLPLHFLTLGSALSGAAGLEGALAWTRNPLALVGEWGLVTALALHMALGLRVLAVEWFSLTGRTATLVSACVAASLGVGVLFLLNAV